MFCDCMQVGTEKYGSTSEREVSAQGLGRVFNTRDEGSKSKPIDAISWPIAKAV